MLLLDLLYWKAIDFKRYFIDKERKIHLYGIIGIVGLYGGGKTMTLSHTLDELRKKYGDKIYIATNYFYSGQDFPINSWEDLLPEYDRPVVFGYDEIQNEFNSRDYKNFPLSLMTLLTQNRKGNGKRILYTAQDFTTVDTNFRKLTKDVWVCKTLFGRLTSVKCYDRQDYIQLYETVSVDKKMKIHPFRKFKFVQTDAIRNSYDSFQMLDTARNKTYVEQLNKDKV